MPWLWLDLVDRTLHLLVIQPLRSSPAMLGRT
jgi:hypothetical protein